MMSVPGDCYPRDAQQPLVGGKVHGLPDGTARTAPPVHDGHAPSALPGTECAICLPRRAVWQTVHPSSNSQPCRSLQLPPALPRPDPRQPVNNCVESQALPAVGTRFGFQGTWSRSTAFRMRSSSHMAAANATFRGWPHQHKRMWKSRMADATDAAGIPVADDPMVPIRTRWLCGGRMAAEQETRLSSSPGCSPPNFPPGVRRVVRPWRDCL